MPLSDLEPEIEYYSSVEVKPIEWLWYPYVPYGKLTIIQGDPGEGKTALALYIATMQANGGCLPFSDNKLKPSVVVYQNTEDGVSDTIKPRLDSYGANCDNICYIKEESKPLDLADERIEKTINETNARVFILDPIQAFLGNIDMQRANEVRPLMKRLSLIAERYNCAIIMVGHLNKRDSGKDIYRSLGSIDIVAAARSVLLVSRVDDINRRCLTHIKSNLSICGPDLQFSVTSNGVGDWAEASNLEPKEDKQPVVSLRMQAEQLLTEMLSEKDMVVVDATKALKEQGISERTVKRARQQIGVQTYKKGQTWYWTLKKGASDNE